MFDSCIQSSNGGKIYDTGLAKETLAKRGQQEQPSRSRRSVFNKKMENKG